MKLLYMFFTGVFILQFNLHSQQLSADHLFILVDESAPGAKVLKEAGLKMDPDTLHHTGQGTSAVFFILIISTWNLCGSLTKRKLRNPGIILLRCSEI